MVKITIPKGFGFVPRFREFPRLILPGGRKGRKIAELEFVRGTPLEYLQRWLLANDVFEDCVRLASVVQWKDGLVSFCILQPHYNGDPATPRQITEYFENSGWSYIRDPSGEHELFFNYAFQVLAVDAMPRNCYLNAKGLQPFDVILAKPDSDLERHLSIYPDS